MKCPKTNMLQALADNELDNELQDSLAEHVSGCKRCKIRYDKLISNNIFTNSKLSQYSRHCVVNLKQNMDTKVSKPTFNFNIKKEGVLFTMLKFKKTAAAAIIIVIMAVCFAVQPIRAAISDIISVFSVDKTEDIKITEEDLESIYEQFSETGTVYIEKIGKLKIAEGSLNVKSRRLSIDNINNFNLFEILKPENDPVDTTSMYCEGNVKIEFTPNVKNLNSLMEYYGGNRFFPKKLHGKTIKIELSQGSVLISGFINSKQPEQSYRYFMNQAPKPVITVPEGIKEKDVTEPLIQLFAMYMSLNNQLFENKINPENALKAEFEKVDIGEYTGYLMTTRNVTIHSSKPTNETYTDYMLFGIKENTVYMIETDNRPTVSHFNKETADTSRESLLYFAGKLDTSNIATGR